MESLARLSVFKSILLLDDSGTANDTAYKLALVQATKMAAKLCARELVLTEYEDELYSTSETQDCGRNLYPYNWPITEVAAVKVWDTSSRAFVTLDAADYDLLRERYIRYPKLGREGYGAYNSFPSGPEDNIKLSYTAGYDTDGWDDEDIDGTFAVPEDLELAIALLTKWNMDRPARAGVKSESLGPSSVTFADLIREGLPQEICSALEAYIRIRI